MLLLLLGLLPYCGGIPVRPYQSALSEEDRQVMYPYTVVVASFFLPYCGGIPLKTYQSALSDENRQVM